MARMSGSNFSFTKRGNVIGLNSLLKNKPKSVQLSILQDLLNQLRWQRNNLNRRINRAANFKRTYKTPDVVYEETGKMTKGVKKTVKQLMHIEWQHTNKILLDAAINNVEKRMLAIPKKI